MSNVNPPAKATRREWIGLAIIALPCMVYAMDLTVLNLALPAISAELDPSASQLLWIVDVYGFLVAGFLITMGTLGDRIGRRKLLLIGAAAFAAASVIAAFSRSAEMLIAMRALLGVAGATLAPSTMSLIRNMFHDEHERQFAIGVWIASFSLGAAIGPDPETTVTEDGALVARIRGRAGDRVSRGRRPGRSASCRRTAAGSTSSPPTRGPTAPGR